MQPTLPSPGARLRAAVEAERPLQIVGAVNAFCALLAERAGFRALYLSGAGVANASLGLPDLGMTTLPEVCEDVRRITQATAPLPVKLGDIVFAHIRNMLINNDLGCTFALVPPLTWGCKRLSTTFPII